MLDSYQQITDVIARSLHDHHVYIIIALIIIFKLVSVIKNRNIPQFEKGKLIIVDSNKAHIWFSTLFVIAFLSFMLGYNIIIYQAGKTVVYHVISGIILLFAIRGVATSFRRMSVVTCSIDRNSRTITLREAGSRVHRDLSYSFDEVDSFDCETKLVRSSSSRKTRYRLNLILKNGEIIHLREKFGGIRWKRWYKAVRDFDGDGRIDHKDITYTDTIQDNIKSEIITFFGKPGKKSKTESFTEYGSSAHWMTRQKKTDGQFVLLIYYPKRSTKKRIGGFKFLLSRLFFATLGKVLLKFYLKSNFLEMSDVNHLKGIITKPEIMLLLPHFTVLTDSESAAHQFLSDSTQKELIKLAELARSQDLFTLFVLFNSEGLRLVYSASNDTKIHEAMGLAGVRITKTIS